MMSDQYNQAQTDHWDLLLDFSDRDVKGMEDLLAKAKAIRQALPDPVTSDEYRCYASMLDTEESMAEWISVGGDLHRYIGLQNSKKG